MTGQEEQESPRTAQATLIGLYVWADGQWTMGLGRLFKRLRHAHGIIDLQAAVHLLQHEERRIVDTLNTRTPRLLNMMEQETLREARTVVRRIPPKPPTPVTLLEPPEPPRFDFTMPLGERATMAIHTDLRTELKDIRARILRQHDDLYKLTAAGSATHEVMANGDTIKDAQRTMMRDLLTHGVTGFTDTAGRRWQLSSYVEMAVRTAAMRARNEAHLTVMQAAGITLFTVPTHMHTCPVCFAWQGKVLSVTPDAQADATIEEARAAGLWHPNCEHTITSWHAGDPHPDPGEWSERDDVLWKASQHQRELERDIRAQKRVLAYSGEPLMRQQARQRIRGYQRQLRDLTHDTGLLRRSHREQPDLGLRR
ncbi:MAG: phage minor capsid protein [Bifidobacterium mongoliense]|jgi:hypothetical protein|uniref:phage minor capsid protein n=1 Tax=Bifidobacterium mongoliense TaxID=518643 RepID=UPI002F35B0B9